LQSRLCLFSSQDLSLTIAKVPEPIIEKWFLSFIEPHLDNYQFGCRKSRSTTHALIAILHTWMTALDSHGSVRSVFCGFSKSLWFGRSQNSVSGSTVQCPRSKTSKGNAPGPLAFLVLIYDLSTGFPLGPLHKYVDDTTLSKLVQPKQLDTLILTYLADLYWLILTIPRKFGDDWSGIETTIVKINKKRK